MSAPFESLDALDRFVSEVRQQLDASGFTVAASRLAAVQGTAFATASEWLGELGTAVNAIRGDLNLSSTSARSWRPFGPRSVECGRPSEGVVLSKAVATAERRTCPE
jgi:hypothetical protein